MDLYTYYEGKRSESDMEINVRRGEKKRMKQGRRVDEKERVDRIEEYE